MSNFNLDKKIEFKGYWYLPSNPENAVAGFVVYSPNEKITLELIGSFDDSPFEWFKKNKEAPVIYGKTSDAKNITLLQAHQSSSFNFNADFPIIKYSCNYMIIGKHLRDLNEKCQYWASIRIPELTYWCYPGALELTTKYIDEEKTCHKVSISFISKYHNVADIIKKVQIDDETSIALMKGVNFDGSEYLLTPKIEQYTYLEIYKKTEASIKDFLYDIFMFEQFLSLATLSVVKCSYISIFDKEIYQQVDEDKFYKPIHIIHPFWERNSLTQKTSKPYKFLFNYSAIKDVYEDILSRWYNDPVELAPIRNHLICSLERKRIYSSVDFFIIIQAIEGFYRRFRSAKYRRENNLKGKASSKLYPILEELIDEFSDIDWLKKHRVDIDAVVSSRQYFSHFMPKQQSIKILDGWELFKQTKKIRILLLCCILSYIGFDHAKINYILNQSNSDIIEK